MECATAVPNMMKERIAECIVADSWNLKPNREYPSSNCSHCLTFDFKRVTLEAFASVVGITSYLGEGKVLHGSGFVVECTRLDGKFVSLILTSATLLRPEDHIDAVADDIKISVILFNEISCEGDVCGFDFHYNIGVIKIKTDAPIATSRIRHINDSISVDPNLLDDKPLKFDPQSNKFNLVPGETVVALGRYDIGGSGLMAVAGKFSVSRIKLDCQELFRAEIIMCRHGIGGPLINCDGEVIGINFYSLQSTPFLPINIVSMWWEQFKKNGHCLLPQLGMVLGNLYLAEAANLELVIQTFPNIFEGVFVDKVGSDAGGLLPLDVIVECDGKSIRSILEFFELIWDKVGQTIHLVVLRPSDGGHYDVTVFVGSVGQNQINRWPLPWIRKRVRDSWRGLGRGGLGRPNTTQ